MDVGAQNVGLDLTTGSIWKTLLVFSGPIILTNVIQQIYSLVDLIVAGQFIGTTGTVGVSTGGEIADFVMPMAVAFSMAGQIFISQLMGAGEKARAQRSVGTLLTIMIIISLLTLAVTLLFCEQLLRLLQCPKEAWSQARDYMIITALGMPFIFGYNGVCGALRGMGESKKPLMFIVVAAVLNIVLDLILVAWFRLEAAGTAIATVMSEFGSFAAASLFLYRHKEAMGFRLSLSYFRPDRDAAKKIVLLAIPQMVRNCLVHFSMIWVNANINAYGMTASSTNSIGNKVQKFMQVYINGVESAAASMVGQNLGAKKPERAKNAVLCTLGFCLTIAAASSVLFLAIPRQLYALFTADSGVVEFGVTYLRIMVMTIFMNGFTGSLQSMPTGCGNVSMTFALGIVDGVVSRIGFSLLFLYAFKAGVTSFFWGTAFSRTITGCIVLWYFLSGRWRTRRLLTEL